jgi:hypothetical protein
LKYGKLPANLSEVGLTDTIMHLSFYEKVDTNEYIVWYGTGLGESEIYRSSTKIWKSVKQ